MIMPLPVVKVASGGVPVSQATNALGTPCILAVAGMGITVVPSGGMPITDAGTGIFTGGGGPFSLTCTDWKGDISQNVNVTYNSGGDPNIGAPDPNRIVAVCMGRRITGVRPISVTIGGISATPVPGAFTAGGNIQQADIWYAAVPTGTTAAVTVNWDPAASAFSESVIGVYRIITATPAPTIGKSTMAPNGGLSLTYTVPPGGAALNFWTQRDATTASSPYVAWANATKDFYLNPGNRGASGALTTTPGSVTVSCDQVSTSNIDVVSMTAAVWGP